MRKALSLFIVAIFLLTYLGPLSPFIESQIKTDTGPPDLTKPNIPSISPKVASEEETIENY